MAVEVKVPSVGESITSGMVAQWHKENGDHVDRGDVLYTLETDKISTEVEAEGSGRLEIIVEEGAEVPIGTVVALISSEEGAPAVSISDSPFIKEETLVLVEASTGASRGTPAPEEDRPGPGELSPVEDLEIKVPAFPGDDQPVTAGERIERVARAAEKAAAMMMTTHAARPAETREEWAPKIAPPLKLVPGPAAAPGEAKAEKDAPPAAAPAVPDERVTRLKMTPLRRKIATHLVAAQQEAAILTTFNECDMGAIMDVRRQVQESFVAKHGVKLGFMSFFIKAVVRALKAVPQINARVDGDEIVTQHYYDIGVAVGTTRGLLVPVVRDCDKMDFAGIEHAIGDYAQRAREGKIQLEDLQGGVFTISNGGIYGSMLSTPILNPPQSGILGMHTIQERPVAIEGKVVIRPMMYLALSYDHRIVDGKEAVTFLKLIKESIEEPARLLV